MFPLTDEAVSSQGHVGRDKLTDSHLAQGGFKRSFSITMVVTASPLSPTCLLSLYLYCAAFGTVNKCSIRSKCFGCTTTRASTSSILNLLPQRYLYLTENLPPPLGSPLCTCTNWSLAYSHFTAMVIYSHLVMLCFINSFFCTVLTCAVSACSSISSNSWYSSSSGSAPESRAALAMKYGGSSPMAVPAPWEENNPDLFLCSQMGNAICTDNSEG